MIENKESNGLYIIPIDGKHLCDLNKTNQPFSVFGRLIPAFAKGEWIWAEELFETPYEKQYPDDELDYSKK